ncbi:hypothetical protein QA640_09120 [Bradyrhizobium sp. CB82]|uniref:hypothetical protein n=1 Tax=Bradyrhizobium sp. CB82 TaxID=3039159 RepID=UPI0024B231FF|nr:hypothetical protein [Bradyrhizobium sp. CB82]WFU42600.1 hypothetical protein QA640_09120 [Bradyrhizobium sp. CB82]
MKLNISRDAIQKTFLQSSLAGLPSSTYLKVVTARPEATIGDENACRAPAHSREQAMQVLSESQSSTFEYRLTQEAVNLRQQAQGMPVCVRRAELLQKARQIDVALEMNKWLSSPGLQPPL